MEIHESCNDSIKVDNGKVFHSIKLDTLTQTHKQTYIVFVESGVLKDKRVKKKN